MKTILLFCLTFINLCAQNPILEKQYKYDFDYYSIDSYDQAVFVLYSDGLLVLKYLPDNNHELVYQYPLTVNSESLLKVSGNLLFVKSVDSLLVFNLLNQFEPSLDKSFLYKDKLAQIIPFGPYVIFDNGTEVKGQIIDIEEEIKIIYTFNVNISSPDIGFIYPWMIKKYSTGFEIFKYIENNISYETFIDEAGTARFYTFGNLLAYFVWYSTNPFQPPQRWFFAIRDFNEVDFPIINKVEQPGFSHQIFFAHVVRASGKYFSLGGFEKHYLFLRNGEYIQEMKPGHTFLSNKSYYTLADTLWCGNDYTTLEKTYRYIYPNLLLSVGKEIVIQKNNSQNQLIDIAEINLDKIYYIKGNNIVTKNGTRYGLYEIVGEQAVFRGFYNIEGNVKVIINRGNLLLVANSRFLNIFIVDSNQLIEYGGFSGYEGIEDIFYADSIIIISDSNIGIQKFNISGSIVLPSWSFNNHNGPFKFIRYNNNSIIRDHNTIYLVDVSGNSLEILDSLTFENLDDISITPNGIFCIQEYSTEQSLIQKLEIEGNKFQTVYSMSFPDNDLRVAESGDKLILFNEQNIYWFQDSSITVSVNDHKALLYDFNLSQNYPNPFNPTTKIKYRIPDFGFTNLKIYDVLGTEIATLVNEEKPAGEYEVEFSAGSLRDGSDLSSGVYFYTLKTGGYIKTNKMILMK